MSLAKKLSKTRQRTNDDRLKYLIGLQCAPVLMGLKTANTISIPEQDVELLLDLIIGTGLEVIKLYDCRKKYILFVYRHDLMQRHLEQNQVREFLVEFGYDRLLSTSNCLFQLVDHFQRYSRDRQEFPHELGVFLQYPIEDMRGFIQNSGKNCLCCGYWKVYTNEAYARSIFRQYDTAKAQVAYGLERGWKFQEIARSR